MHSQHDQSEFVPAPDSLVEVLPARVRDLAALRGLGYSLREIGEQVGISAQAVSLMLLRYRRSLKSLKSAVELRELSCRAVNALGRHGIRSREEARRVNLLERLEMERNCGRKTRNEIKRWLEADDSSTDSYTSDGIELTPAAFSPERACANTLG
jgi:predicted transcriptional regulator